MDLFIELSLTHGLYSPWDSPGQHTGVGSLSLLHGSSQPRHQTRVSSIAGGFLTNWAIRETRYLQNRQTHRHRKQTYYQRGNMVERNKIGGRDEHMATTICRIDKQQRPPNTTGTDTQYSIITYMGKESEKQWIYIYVYIYIYIYIYANWITMLYTWN